jgi:hypothetical protein
MFAELMHTFVDTLNQSFLLFGAYQTEQKPDKKHQMGYGKAAFFWSLVSAFSKQQIYCIEIYYYHQQYKCECWSSFFFICL